MSSGLQSQSHPSCDPSLSPPPPQRPARDSNDTKPSSSPLTCHSQRREPSSDNKSSTSPFFNFQKFSSFLSSSSQATGHATMPPSGQRKKESSLSPPYDTLFTHQNELSDVNNGVTLSNGHVSLDSSAHSNNEPEPTSAATSNNSHSSNSRTCVLAPFVPAKVGFSPKTPPKKPPRASRPVSAFTALVTDEDSDGRPPPPPPPLVYSNSQRFQPYVKPIETTEQTPLDPAPNLIPSDVTTRLADLESSLETSFHGNPEDGSNEGGGSPLRRGHAKMPGTWKSPSSSSGRSYRRYMNSDGTRLSPTSLRNEFEYSMEPRNFSRPAVKSPGSLSPPPCIVENGKEEEEERMEKEGKREEGKREEEVHCGIPIVLDEVVALMDSASLETPTNQKETLSTSSNDKKWLLETGVYDTLLPQSPGSFAPHLSSSPYDVSAKTSTPPQEKSSTVPKTTPSSKLRTHQRRNSEDVNLLELSIERRQLNVIDDNAKGETRHSPTSPKKKRKGSEASRRSFSPPVSVTSAGVEESVNWHFMDPSDYKEMVPKQNPQQTRKTSFFSNWFGGGEKHDIYNPKNAATLLSKYLVRDSAKIGVANDYGDTPLHCYIKSGRDDRLDLLLTLLVHCNVKLLDINKEDSHGDTPLHVATKLTDDWCIKALISFGADVNCCNNEHQTPLDIIMSHAQKPDSSSFDALLELFSELHALPGGHHLSKKQPHLLNESLNSLVNESYEIEESVQLGDYLEERRMAAFVFKLEEMLQKQNLQFSINTGISLPPGQFDPHGTFFDPLISRQNQILRINEYKSTLEFKKGAGSRMLFLDGGGIRGLIQIEILSFIENMTGRKITELFDWIVGTSTGGIIVLALVYLGMSLGEVRQLYFQLREEVFAGGVLSITKRTDALENMLKTQFKNKRLKDVEYPKVLISAVSSKTNPPSLHYFNNCFDDKYSDELVWKVARYTSAGPTYFSECDDFVDGGVLANNPCTTSWVEICDYHDRMGIPKPKVAMAISVGTGNYPPEILGETDLFGKGWLDIRGTFRRAHRFIKMLSTALVESENVAQIFAKTCEALDVKFLRFSPSMPMTIRPDETDSKVLIDMIIKTKVYLHTQECKRNLDKLVRHFRHLAEVSRGLNLNK